MGLLGAYSVVFCGLALFSNQMSHVLPAGGTEWNAEEFKKRLDQVACLPFASCLQPLLTSDWRPESLETHWQE